MKKSIFSLLLLLSGSFIIATEEQYDTTQAQGDALDNEEDMQTQQELEYFFDAFKNCLLQNPNNSLDIKIDDSKTDKEQIKTFIRENQILVRCMQHAYQTKR